MAYTIHARLDSAPGPMASSGQTRQQVIGALEDLGWIDRNEPIPPLPRFGKALIICRQQFMAELGKPTFYIIHR